MPKALWIQDDLAFVCLYKSNEVAIVNLKNFKVIDTIRGFNSPNAVVFCNQ